MGCSIHSVELVGNVSPNPLTNNLWSSWPKRMFRQSKYVARYEIYGRSRQTFVDHSVRRVKSIRHGTVQHHLHSVIHSLRYQIIHAVQTQLQGNPIQRIVHQTGLHDCTRLRCIERNHLVVDQDLRNHGVGPERTYHGTGIGAIVQS